MSAVLPHYRCRSFCSSPLPRALRYAPSACCTSETLAQMPALCMPDAGASAMAGPAAMPPRLALQGLMLKRLDAGSAYQPSKRSESWIKIKRCVLFLRVRFRSSLVQMHRYQHVTLLRGVSGLSQADASRSRRGTGQT
jgi:hypothetical protein